MEQSPPTPTINLEPNLQTNAISHPPPFDECVNGRSPRGEDELLVMIANEAVLIDEDAGQAGLRTGDLAAFRKDDGIGHHVGNEWPGDSIHGVAGGGERLVDAHPDVDMVVNHDGR